MEIEIRAKIRDVNDIKNKLKDLDAKYEGENILVDYYFGDIKLYEKIGHSFWIRLRVKNDDSIQLAYKGSTGIDGVYEEYEQKMQDLETSLTILSSMGLDNPITVRKKRISYTLGDLNIEIDEIDEKGMYIEIEKISDKVDKSELYDILDQIGIPNEDCFEKGFITLFLEDMQSPFSEWIKN